MAGQTESVTRAVHDNVLDDAKGLGVFVREQVLWIRQTGNVAQPGNTHNPSCSVCFQIKSQTTSSKIDLVFSKRVFQFILRITADSGCTGLRRRQPAAPSVSHCAPAEIRVRQVSVGADDAVGNELLL